MKDTDSKVRNIKMKKKKKKKKKSDVRETADKDGVRKKL